MTPLLWNVGTALIAAPLALLVIWGSKQDAHRIVAEGGPRFWRWHPSDRIRVAILILHIAAFVRAAYYDIWRPFHGILIAEEYSRQVSTAWVNGALGAVSILIALMVLSSFHHTIPEQDRPRWTWLTAPFYFH